MTISQTHKKLLIFLVLVLVLTFSFLNSTTWKSPHFEPWGVLHYYLGSKYYTEIGPFDLYACVTKTSAFSKALDFPVRDLRTYEIVNSTTQVCPFNNFSETRWNSFELDTKKLFDTEPAIYWKEVLTDKGYNATPVWSVVFGKISNEIDLGTRKSIVLFNSDLILYALTVLIVWYFSNFFTAVVVALLLFSYWGNFGRVGGNYFQYVWLPLLAYSAGTWKKEKHFLSGISLGFAGIFHVFPLLFSLPILIRALYDKFALNVRDKTKEAQRFFIGIFLVVTVGLFIGSLSARGVEGWLEWSKKIKVHSEYLNAEVFNIGLPNAVANYFGETSTHSTYEEDTLSTLQRKENFQENKNIYLFMMIMLVSVISFYATQISFKKIFVLGFPTLYALLSLSPYYYASLSLLPFVLYPYSESERYTTWFIVSLYLLHFILWADGYISYSSREHMFSEVIIFIFLAIILLSSERELRQKQELQ